GPDGNGPGKATIFVASTSPSRTLEQNERSVLHPLTLLPGGTTPSAAGPRFLPALGGFRQCEPRRWARPGRVPLIAVELTRSPALIAGIAVTTTLAWLVVGLPAGALGDRLDRRIIALTIAVLRTVLLGTVALLLFTDHLTIGMLFAAAFLLGV